MPPFRNAHLRQYMLQRLNEWIFDILKLPVNPALPPYMGCLSCIYILGSSLDYLHQGDPKCFGTGQVSILAIASITFPSSTGILEQKTAIYIYKPPTTHKPQYFPSEVAHRWIGVLGDKSKSGVGGGINWIKGFLPLL